MSDSTGPSGTTPLAQGDARLLSAATTGPGPDPVDTAAIADDAGQPLPWDEGRRRVADARMYWLATVGPGGAPHVRPVLAVWVDGTAWTTSRPGARKARNLADDPRVALTVRDDDMDVVVEARAQRVTDPDQLERVAAAYNDKYGWPATVAGDAFDAPYGAPTAGPPPYHVFRLAPTVVFGLGTDEAHAPRSTRWRFPPATLGG